MERLTFSVFACTLVGLHLWCTLLFFKLLLVLLFSGLMRSAVGVATCALTLAVPVPRHFFFRTLSSQSNVGFTQSRFPEVRSPDLKLSIQETHPSDPFPSMARVFNCVLCLLCTKDAQLEQLTRTTLYSSSCVNIFSSVQHSWPLAAVPSKRLAQ